MVQHSFSQWMNEQINQFYSYPLNVQVLSAYTIKNNKSQQKKS